MAEGMLDGILGEEEEKPEVESAGTLASVEALPATVAAKLAGNYPGAQKLANCDIPPVYSTHWNVSRRSESSAASNY